MNSSLSNTRNMLAISAVFAAGTQIQAQVQSDSGSRNLSELIVSALKCNDFKVDKSKNSKFTTPLRDVPQTVTIVPKEVIKQQNAATLLDILKNSPGISIQAGEGGLATGDNMVMRGFNARNDLFVDGVRNTNAGGYVNDAFDTEQVEISKGPSSTNSGRGSTGGSINIVSKAPTLENEGLLGLTVGSDDLHRAQLDVNRKLGWIPNAAFRLSAVTHDQRVAGRDWVDQKRHGIAPSLAFGLETDTRLTLQYSYLQGNNVPDYGLAYVSRGLVPASTFYGFLKRDFEDLNSNRMTAIFEKDFFENFTFRNVLRHTYGTRLSHVTAPRFDATLARTDSTKPRDQLDRSWSNTSELSAKIKMGNVEQELVTGLEVGRDTSKNFIRNVPSVIAGNLGTVSVTNPFAPVTGSFIRNGLYAETAANTLSAYALDTIKVTKDLDFNLGARYDHLSSDFENKTATALTQLSGNDDTLSYRAAVVYRPTKESSVYMGYGTSFNPSIEGGVYGTSAANFGVEPEKNNTIELGTKWDLLSNQLQFTASVFRTTKTNARTTDPVSGEVRLDGEQMVQGIEIGFVGNVTEQWKVFGGYTFLDSELKKSLSLTDRIGADLAQTPSHSCSVWSSYAFTPEVEAGLGIRYIGSRYNGTSMTRNEAGSYQVIDAMASYQVTDQLSLRLNAYNLTDREYIERVGGGHFVPGAGRTVSFSSNYSF